MIVPLPLLSIAPMIDWTYSSFRMFMRMLAPNALLYTEMMTTGAVSHNPLNALSYCPKELPLVLQLGGSCLDALIQSAKAGETAGFSEINLNLGCPSPRVQAGSFGACLMKEPDLVYELLSSLKQSVSIPVTAKIRIGVDEQDSAEFFHEFYQMLVSSGIDAVIVHARKAWLHGLNPKQNRTIPPIDYERAYEAKKRFPHLPLILNGDIRTFSAIKEHLTQVDGVMLGRLACDNPYAIHQIHHQLYPSHPLESRSILLRRYFDYLNELDLNHVSIALHVKPFLNLGFGISGIRRWRGLLTEAIQRRDWNSVFASWDIFHALEQEFLQTAPLIGENCH